ncbi:hypothetical protein [Microbispora sp. CA-102843]|uniref:hypothetical protein n=1 Tax=Microbispora sp. CA-102843 TaxID=3239952 RepID=UPI003D8D08F4
MSVKVAPTPSQVRMRPRPRLVRVGTVMSKPNVWMSANPDEDLPGDFEDNRDVRYAVLAVGWA